jgi:competence protein ComEC
VGLARFALPATLAGVAAGVLVADAIEAPALPALLAGLALVMAGAGARVRWLTVVGIVGLAVGIGLWRGAEAAPAEGAASVASLVDGSEHELAGTIIDDPRPREDRLQLVLAGVHARRDGHTAVFEDRLLVWLPRGIDASSGDRLRISAELELAEDFDGFAYREYLARQGIGAIARARTAEVAPGPGGIGAALASVRAALVGGLNDIVPEPEAALGAGIVLGIRASIAPEINEAFATAGLTHVVAISGWNIAIVATLVGALAGPLARRPGGRWTTAIVTATTVGGYVMLTGASPSVVRAALMAGAMLVARLGGSRAHAASALALAALVMLLAAPPVLWDVGFQLSLLATAGLVWFGGSVERRLPGWWPAWIREPIALTLAAQLTTLPVILVNFERLSLVAPFANVVVVPFVPIAMLFGAIASLVGLADAVLHVPLVGDVLTWFAGGAAWLTLWVIVSLGTAAAAVPLAAVDASLPAPFAVAWFGVLALGSWAVLDGNHAEPEPAAEAPSEPGRLARLAARSLRPLPILGVLAAVLLGITIATRPDGRLHMTVLSIGQGDAILVETPHGTTMLVDGGPDPELTLRRLGANLPFHVRDIDLLVLSHPHQDHVAGLVEVLDRYRVGAVLEAGIGFDNPAYERLLADADAAGTPILRARSGAEMRLDTTTDIRVVYPSGADADAPLPDGDINNASIVMELRSGAFRALLTGDAEAPVEAMLIERGSLTPVDVLKVGHHGSHSSSTPEFLSAVHPSVAVISAGIGNDYGHPAPETLAALSGTAVFRTDLDGDIEIVTDGSAFQVRTGRGWSDAVRVQATVRAGSIGPWPFPTDPPPCASSPTPGCPTGSSSTPAALPGSRSRRPASWPRRRSRSTGHSSRPPPSSTTSTSPRSGAPAASTASSARCGSRRRATPNSRCRSPPTRSRRSSTPIATRSAGRRSSWPSPIATWRRSS